MIKQCKICGHSDDFPVHTAKEMMLGTRHKFSYFQCDQCDCLQISSFPENIGDYYPDGYYSLTKKSSSKLKIKMRGWIDNRRVDDLLSKNLFGRFANSISKTLDYAPWIKNCKIKKSNSILDIGCGHGRLLTRMAMGGFTRLYGVDPFMSKSMDSNGITLYKGDFLSFSKQNEHLRFDLIMLHHSLEHMPNPLEIIHYCLRHLDDNGTVLIRVPLVDSYAWEHYKEKWVQLDAPRHYFLFSAKSIKLIAETAGLTIEKIVYDSSKFQFIGSELYMKDIALNADKRTKKIFSRKEIKKFSESATVLNSNKQGDQAAFYLKKM